MVAMMVVVMMSVCCGLVVHYEVQHKCCLSRSVQPSVSMWLVVVMMMKLSVCCGLVAQCKIHHKWCLSHALSNPRSVCGW